MYRISHFEVALRYEERLREADLLRRNAVARRSPDWAARLVAAIGLRLPVARPAV